MFSAGVDLHPAERGRRGLRAPLPAGAAPALRHGVLLSEARGGRGQRPRHCRRLRAGMLRRPAHRRARRRPHRRHRAAGRRAVSAAGVRGDALCDAAALFRRRHPQRRDLSARGRAGARPDRRGGRSRRRCSTAPSPPPKHWPRCRRGPSRRPSSKSASRSPTRWSATRPRIDKVAEEIWTAPATLEHIRDYVARTFKKG